MPAGGDALVAYRSNDERITCKLNLTLFGGPSTSFGDPIPRILARSNTSRERWLVEVRELTEVIAPPLLTQPVCRDPYDDVILALGLAANVDFVVSGDGDLLALNTFQGIAIVTPTEALRLIDGK